MQYDLAVKTGFQSGDRQCKCGDCPGLLYRLVRSDTKRILVRLTRDDPLKMIMNVIIFEYLAVNAINIGEQ